MFIVVFTGVSTVQLLSWLLVYLEGKLGDSITSKDKALLIKQSSYIPHKAGTYIGVFVNDASCTGINVVLCSKVNVTQVNHEHAYCIAVL